jgi:hypothetical protein
MTASDGPLTRVLEQAGGADVLEALAERLAGADLTTLLLEVQRRRAGRLTPTSVLRSYERDRFVAPGTIDLRALREAEDLLLDALPGGFDQIVLAPLLPLGAHSALSTVPQNNLVSTIRSTEAAADPTAGLALEAAVRRRRRSAGEVRLASVQRVTRAQRFEGPTSFAHFTLLGLVSAGRTSRNRRFERDAAVEHVQFHVDALTNAGADHLEVRVSDLSDDQRDAPIVAAVHDAIDVAVIDAPERQHGRGYYPGFCFRVDAEIGDAVLEASDGGFVDWTQHLVANAAERLLISGIGVDRIAIARRG